MADIVITHAQLRMERLTAMRDDLPDGPARLRTRDIGGNKLVDVVNPATGFVMGVRSALESGANNTPGHARPGISASHEEAQNLPRRDEATGLWWVGPNRLVQRTIDTPEGPLKVARVVKPAVAEKLDKRAEAASKVKRGPKDASSKGQPRAKAGAGSTRHERTGVTGAGSGPTAKEIAEYVKVKYGFTGRLTPEIRRAARVAIEHDRQVREYTKR